MNPIWFSEPHFLTNSSAELVAEHMRKDDSFGRVEQQKSPQKQVLRAFQCIDLSICDPVGTNKFTVTKLQI